MKPKHEKHKRIQKELARDLRTSGFYRHVWENVHYRRGNVIGEIDILAVIETGEFQFYEIKSSGLNIDKAQRQYDKFKSVFGRDSLGYMVSEETARRLN